MGGEKERGLYGVCFLPSFFFVSLPVVSAVFGLVGMANWDRLGMASVLLEMVPFASMVFEFSNAVGAALWAADLEKANK